MAAPEGIGTGIGDWDGGGIPPDEVRMLPEPATLTLLPLGLAGIGITRRGKRPAANRVNQFFRP
ncbi:MAG: PEP-CTERM sorting domain-containing protein [Nitrosospira sp.]|nr:PEP-CTERM sorting domain-containing protein [Nitrosospira sp.]